jgi:hypothetical protein
MKDRFNKRESIPSDASSESAAAQTDERLRRLWDFPPMQELLREHAEDFEVKIARRVVDEIDPEHLARYLARHLRGQPCEDRDVRFVAGAYVASFYIQRDQRRLVFHTNLKTHLTCVLLLPARGDYLRQLDRLAR